MLEKKVAMINENYEEVWEEETMTEEEFIYDSLRNRPFFDIIDNIDLHWLHLVNGSSSLWEKITQNDNEKSFETPLNNNEYADDF